MKQNPPPVQSPGLYGSHEHHIQDVAWEMTTALLALNARARALRLQQRRRRHAEGRAQ